MTRSKTAFKTEEQPPEASYPPTPDFSSDGAYDFGDGDGEEEEGGESDAESGSELDESEIRRIEEDAIKMETLSNWTDEYEDEERDLADDLFDPSTSDEDHISPFLDAQEFAGLEPALQETASFGDSEITDEDLILSYCFASSSSGSDTEPLDDLPAAMTPAGRTQEIPAHDAAPPRLADWTVDSTKQVAILDGHCTAGITNSPMVRPQRPENRRRESFYDYEDDEDDDSNGDVDGEIIDLDELIFTDALLPSTQTNLAPLPSIRRRSPRRQHPRHVMKGEALITPVKRKRRQGLGPGRLDGQRAEAKWEVHRVELGDLFAGL